MSSFGVLPVNGKKILTKKALREAVAAVGIDAVMVFDTSGFDNRGTVPLSALRSADVIVGPDVYSKRDWYANVKPAPKTGVLRVV